MTDLAYINTRIRAMRSTLLTRDETEEILALPGADAVTDHLLQGPYAKDLAEAAHSVAASDAVDLALNSNFVTSLRKIQNLLPKPERRVLDQLYAGIDLQCIKSILRGLYHQLPPERKQDLPPAIGLPRRLLDELTQEADIPHAVGVLRSAGSHWGVMLRDLLKKHGTHQDLQTLEYELDCAHYESVYGLGDPTISQLAGLEAELNNMSSILAHLSDEEKPGLLPQGPRSCRFIRRLRECRTGDEVIAVLSESPYQKVLGKALPMMMMDSHRFAALERLLDEELLRQSRRLALLDPLGIAVPCHFVRSKRNEIMNLRLIARGIRNQQPRNALRAALVFTPGVAA